MAKRHSPAIRRLLAEGGSPRLIAEKLTELGKPCTRQVVEHWCNGGYVPGTWAPLVNRAYSIPLYELNPTIYPRDAA